MQPELSQAMTAVTDSVLVCLSFDCQAVKFELLALARAKTSAADGLSRQTETMFFISKLLKPNPLFFNPQIRDFYNC